ncbi:MAG: universal stress protein [Acidimicrobiia bacterium]|nr:universal stress protein [Acidimicrobiia bacterium]
MTWTPDHVVVAVDGSEASNHAARVGVTLAEHRGGKVTLITVVRPPEGWWGVGGAPPSPEAMAVAVTRARTEILDPLAAEFESAECDVELVEEIGDPAGVILRLAESLDADVLVAGRRGSSLVERLMLGSVADRLAHEAPCPVLIVP